MGKILIPGSSGGGVNSDDVTASKAQVLQGYKTVTNDSDDEVVEGTIPNRGNIVDTVSFENAHWDSKYLARMEQGFYSQNGQWKPCVAIPYEVLANVAGIDASKMLDTLTVAGVSGAVRTYGAWNNASEVVNATWENKVHVRFEEGFYTKDGNYKPAAIVPYDVLANAIGIDASKMLSALNVLGKQGQIKSINTQDNNYRVNKSNAFGIDNWTDRNNPVFYVDFPHGNGYYNRSDGHPHVCIDAANLGTAGADSVLSGQTVTSQNGVRFSGTIPRWICGTGDVISAYNNNVNDGFAWDDTYAGRGRGIIVHIPNGAYIQGANYVFLASPNLYPQNVAKNVNINGVTGTRDYIDLINPTWLSDTTLNLQVNTVEKEIHIPNKFSQYNGLFLKVIIWGSTPDGYYKNSNGGACPCVLAVTNFDGGANFTIKSGVAMFYGTLERQGSGFDDFKLTYSGSTAFNLSLNFLITEGFSHQWAGNYNT